MVQTRALLLTDVVDSTRLSEELGDVAMAALWAAHDRVARDLLPRHGGREIDKTDGFLLLFDTVPQAVAYAMAYHRALAALNPPIRARAGLHQGPVILTENAPDDVARGAKPLEVDGIAKPTAARVMSLAVGGQTLLTEEALASLGPTDLRTEAHGHWRMKGVSEPIALFEVGDAQAPFTPPPDGAKVYRVVHNGALWLPVREVRHSLPAERDVFVGRRSDLQALAHRLHEGARLVSILGIGGTGKTRLVTHFGWSWLGDYPGGVWFCDLSEARDVGGILSAVARVLDVPLGADPVTQLGHAIAGRGACLMLIDNVEQVARHAEQTLGPWLDLARQAQFVVTTREVLGLPGEEALALAPLAAAEGAALFVARARAAKRDFVADDPASIEALVALLDSLPLAIELAAARVRVMPPKTLLLRMSERFKLLASSGGRHARQATLRGALDWSWDLLSADERLALAQLSVFEGGFTLEAAEAVLALESLWPMDAVQALVDKSLVRQTSEERFDLLVSVQEYAAEKRQALLPPDESEARHGAWYAGFSREALAAMYGHGGVARGLALARELANLTTGCARAVDQGEPGVAVDLLRGAWEVLGSLGPLSVGVALAERVLAMPGLPPGEAAAARFVLGLALQRSGRREEARGPLVAALAVARDGGPGPYPGRTLEGNLLCTLAELNREQGRVEDALRFIDAALALAREVGDRRREGVALGLLGNLRLSQGHLEEAERHLEAAMVALREVGDRGAEGSVHSGLGHLYFTAGRVPQALHHTEAAHAAHREVGSRRREGVELGNLGSLYWSQGRVDEARARFAEAVTVLGQVGDRGSQAISLGNRGNLLRVVGERKEAEAHLREALAIHREVGFRYGQPYWLAGLALLEADAGRFDEARSLALEGVTVAAPFAAVQPEALQAQARVLLLAGDRAGAREAVAKARLLRPSGKAGALVAAVDALVAAAEGDDDAARLALAEASAVASEQWEGSEVGRLIAVARANLELPRDARQGEFASPGVARIRSR